MGLLHPPSRVAPRVVSVLLALGGLAGCLFPSFDDLQSSGSAPKKDGGSDGEEPEEPSAPGQTPTTPREDSGAAEGGAPPPPPAGKPITCPPSGECTFGAQYCCLGLGGPSTCRALGDDSCPSGALRAQCARQSDCGGTAVCCKTGDEAVCSFNCSRIGDMALCSGEGQCPAHTGCLIELGNGFQGCSPDGS